MQRLVRHLQQLGPLRQGLCLPAERDVPVVRPVPVLLDHRGPAAILLTVRAFRVLPIQRQAGRAVAHLGLELHEVVPVRADRDPRPAVPLVDRVPWAVTTPHHPGPDPIRGRPVLPVLPASSILSPKLRHDQDFGTILNSRDPVLLALMHCCCWSFETYLSMSPILIAASARNVSWPISSYSFCMSVILRSVRRGPISTVNASPWIVFEPSGPLMCASHSSWIFLLSSPAVL